MSTNQDKPGTPDGPEAAGKPPVSAAELQAQLDDLNRRLASLTALNRQQKRKIFDLYTIFEISRNFNAVLDYGMLLETFMLTALAQVGASKGAMFLPHETRPDKYVAGVVKGSGSFPDKRHFFRAGSELLEYVTKINRPQPTADLLGDLSRRGERNILQQFHPGLLVPLIYQSRLSGILLITDKISGREFQPEDIEFLSVLGNQISVAIENARLYEAEKRATHQLRATQEQLVRTERLAALGEMSAKIAHEINNPLGIIKNYLQLIKRSMGPNVEASGYTEVVSQEINRIAGIVRELLDFHRPRVMEFRELDPVAVLDDVLILMERKLQSRGIQTMKRVEAEIPPVEGSPENLKQVFINIVINAADAMPEGGNLVVTLQRNRSDILIHFDDSGPGIDPEIIPRIFEPFFTTKEPGQGTGLGLAVCYGIMKKHGGSIEYSNTANGGRFTVHLPVTEDDGTED